MTGALLAAIAVLLAAIAGLLYREHRRARLITPRADRILFPFIGREISHRTLDATLRLARAEEATLIPAYLAKVPMHLPLTAAMPIEAATAMPLLEAIEQRAQRAGVPVDSRIERGRSDRHALRRLIDHERFDRIVVGASTPQSEGLSAEDVAWLLNNAPGEILVVRPGSATALAPAARSHLPVPAANEAAHRARLDLTHRRAPPGRGSSVAGL